MRLSLSCGVPMLACGLIAGATSLCAAQAYTPPPPPLTTLPPCPVGKDGKPLKKKQKNCDPTAYPKATLDANGKQSIGASAPSAAPTAPTAAQKFPFPGDPPAPRIESPTAKAFPYPGDASPDQGTSSPGSNVPYDPAAAKKEAESPAAKAFPYPGDPAPPDSATQAPAHPTPATPGPEASSNSSSSSSLPADGADGSNAASSPADETGKAPIPGHAKNEYDDDDAAQPKLTDRGSEGRRGKKVIKPQSDTDRVDEDLSVAKFYTQNGNKMGAYLRAKDAVSLQPDYPEAHFVLGEAARKLDKKEEAIAEFTAYLKLAPDGERAGSATKALQELH